MPHMSSQTGVAASAQTDAEAFARLAPRLRRVFVWMGDLGLFAARVVRSAARPPYERRELLRQMDEIGARSVVLIAIAGAAIGIVLSLETRNSLIRFGAESSLPGVIMVS